ncbi:MAG: hypothetical protein P8M71_02835 [Pseudomonadales bacterium]|nr:hypothetical protein [Pseudomonadales bacterium]
MNKKPSQIIFTCLVLFIISNNSHANNWGFLAEMLVSNDNAVSYGDLLETGNLLSEGDSALSYLVNVEYQWNDQFSTALEFSDEQYQDLNKYDSHYHSLSLDWTETIGDFDVSLYGSHINIALDDTDLTLDMASPSLSYFFSNGIFLNLHHTLIDKSLSNPEFNYLNATNRTSGLSTYYFFNHSTAFISISYNHSKENAKINNNYDYRQKTTSIATQKSFFFLGKRSKINISYAIRKRDYNNVSVGSTEYRTFEDRDRIKIYFDTRFSPQWALRLSYDFKDRDSNLTDYAYDNNLYSFRVKYQH